MERKVKVCGCEKKKGIGSERTSTKGSRWTSGDVGVACGDVHADRKDSPKGGKTKEGKGETDRWMRSSERKEQRERGNARGTGRA